MPKIIEDVKNTIITEAKRQALSRGYSAMTIRSVASSCSIAVGTIYNYFPSKDVLAASFLLSDWLITLGEMKAGCEKASSPTEAFFCIHTLLEEYRARYSSVFSDNSAEKSAGGVFREKHRQLRSQISALILPVCERSEHFTPFLPDFIAEALLSWTDEECKFEDLDKILNKLF